MTVTTTTYCCSIISLILLGQNIHAFSMCWSKATRATHTHRQTCTFSNTNPTPSSLLSSRLFETKKSYLDDGFVFGLNGSGIERPKGREPSLVVEGDDLQTKPYQVAVVAATLTFHSLLSIASIQHIITHNHNNAILTTIQTIFTFLAAWTLADFGSGVLHWSVDNYGNGRTPIMGGIIAAFQGHHSAPWTITYRQFANNVYKLCIPFGIPTMLFISLLAGSQHPFITLFFAIFCTTEILSQEFHKFSHQTNSESPKVVNFLQNRGVLLSKKTHALHHMEPYDGNYCIISGICNKPLDKMGFFRWLEHIIYKINRVESNAWKLDPALKERTLRGDYSLSLE